MGWASRDEAQLFYLFMNFLLTMWELEIIVINVVTAKDYFRKTICEKSC